MWKDDIRKRLKLTNMFHFPREISFEQQILIASRNDEYTHPSQLSGNINDCFQHSRIKQNSRRIKRTPLEFFFELREITENFGQYAQARDSANCCCS